MASSNEFLRLWKKSCGGGMDMDWSLTKRNPTLDFPSWIFLYSVLVTRSKKWTYLQLELRNILSFFYDMEKVLGTMKTSNIFMWLKSKSKKILTFIQILWLGWCWSLQQGWQWGCDGCRGSPRIWNQYLQGLYIPPDKSELHCQQSPRGRLRDKNV